MIKKVTVEPGCITCGLCEFLAPKVFQVTDISHVKLGADYDESADQIKQAAEGCPVQVITYKEKDDSTAAK